MSILRSLDMWTNEPRNEYKSLMRTFYKNAHILIAGDASVWAKAHKNETIPAVFVKADWIMPRSRYNPDGPLLEHEIDKDA